MTMVVFTLFFGRMAGSQRGGVPYPLFVFAGLLPWTFFANAIAAAGQSVVGSRTLVTKVYFPRLIIPMATVGGGARRFRRRLGMLLGMMMCLRRPGPGWRCCSCRS